MMPYFTKFLDKIASSDQEQVILEKAIWGHSVSIEAYRWKVSTKFDEYLDPCFGKDHEKGVTVIDWIIQNLPDIYRCTAI
jgi:hypothetical protein